MNAPLLDPSAFIREEGGEHTLHLLVEGAHCGGCVRKIESALGAEEGVSWARMNLSTRRLSMRWRGEAGFGRRLVAKLSEIGFPATPFDPEKLSQDDKREDRALLRRVAAAGFGFGQVMSLSVAVWAGHAQDMGEGTRGLLHWISAGVALPILIYSAQPFARSAWGALKARRMNMDVPIILGIVLAAALSLFETIRGGDHAYFDSALGLTFFLLVGRYLERRARASARSAAERLTLLASRAATLLLPDGGTRSVAADQLRAGDLALIARGERAPADGVIFEGVSEADLSLVTGETTPQRIAPGDRVFAGGVNLGPTVTMRVETAGEKTLLAEIVRLMENAEQARSARVAMADKVIRIYAPTVHLLALATFALWTLALDQTWQTALFHAISVLIVTCPCALGLATPAVQIVASGALYRRGVLLKAPNALERLAGVDCVALDKTGTLTHGRPTLRRDGVDAAALTKAAAIAAASRHPLAIALRAAAPEGAARTDVEERPGDGLIWAGPDGEHRLGRRAFAAPDAAETDDDAPELWYAAPGAAPVRFAFDDDPRPDAADAVGDFRAMGLDVELLSGDRPGAVARAAEAAGVTDVRAGVDPKQKVARLEALKAEGRRPLMVGDGLNDAPALAAAHASISPATAAAVSQTAADAVMQGEGLRTAPMIVAVARRADQLVRMNFAFAIGYNVIAVPIAVAGQMTPLIAAICMSLSSIIVTANALRLKWAKPFRDVPAWR